MKLNEQQFNEAIEYLNEEILNEDLRTFMISKLPNSMINKLFSKLIENLLKSKNTPLEKKKLIQKNINKINSIDISEKRKILKTSVSHIKKDSSKEVEIIEKELKDKLNSLDLKENILNEGIIKNSIIAAIVYSLIVILNLLIGNVSVAIILLIIGPILTVIGTIGTIKSNREIDNEIKNELNKEEKISESIQYEFKIEEE